MNRNLAVVAIWLGASAVALFNAMQYLDAAMPGSSFIPVGNDSFYHARRILDAAFGARGFYEFDTMIHVPEGSWVTWPWAYDYLLSRLLRVIAWMAPGVSPIGALAHVAMFFGVVNTGLFVVIARQLRLSIPLLAIAALAFAGSQLNQQLHGIGTIDHHFIEQTFLLLSLWWGLKLFDTQSPRMAIALGVTLGFAPAFHSALFILQLPLLGALFVMWWRDSYPPVSLVIKLVASLLIATVAALLPSAAFQDLQFSFTTYSWFHFYVAICSGVVIVLMARQPPKLSSLGMLAAAAVVLALPIGSQILAGASFVSGDTGPILASIAEVKSPFALMLGGWGVGGISSLYSLLIFLAPFLLLYFLWSALRERDGAAVFLAVSAVFTLGLMIMQYRLHYFGSWAMILGPLLIVATLAQTRHWQPVVVTVVAAVVYLAAYIPVVQNQRQTEFSAANDPDYQFIQPAFAILDDLCKASPGSVLAYANDGHYIRYHTACSVIANNLLLTPQHFEKVAQVNRLLAMTPETFVAADRGVEYLFVRFVSLPFVAQANSEQIDMDSIFTSNPPLVVNLNLSDAVPPGFELIAELNNANHLNMPYARIFRVLRPQAN